jgi:hypothetical protein
MFLPYFGPFAQYYCAFLVFSIENRNIISTCLDYYSGHSKPRNAEDRSRDRIRPP